ncbi:MAG: DUF503 domain-containing protein [bacterium]|nr:MAG: DUF503 domain-containing protein [bacterium]
MVVARLKLEFFLPGCSSLKQKRFILNSLKARLRNKFNVALCETAFQDKWQRSEIGLATIASSRRGVERTTQAIISFLEKEEKAVLVDSEKELY